jgi:phosphoserine phosphatase/dolichol kinase
LPIKLVVFDVEGVLVPKWRFLLFGASRGHGLEIFVKFAMIGLLYTVRVFSLERSLRTIFRSLRGTELRRLSEVFNDLPLTSGSEQLFKNLRSLGLKTALISSGVPDVFVADLARRLGSDYSRGLQLDVTDGRLTGEIGGDVLWDGKMGALGEILACEGLGPEGSAVVADDSNNLRLLRVCGLSVGFNPDYRVGREADYVINEDLSGVSDILKSGAVSDNRISRSNLIRELIHTGGLVVPFLCIYLFGNFLVAGLLLAVAMIYSVCELLRINGTNVPLVSRITLLAADKPELNEFNTSPIFHALGIAIALLIFPPQVGYAAIAVLSLGDSSASIFGKRFGRKRIPFNRGKSVVGSAVGLVFAFLGALLFVDWFTAAVGAAAGILIEVIPTPFEDNLLIPLVAGTAMYLLRFII